MPPSPTPKAFGLAISDLRSAQGLTQAQLAARASTHVNYVGDLERGTRNPTLNVITRLATALEVRTSELIRDAEERDRKSERRGRSAGSG
jgi:transcriptional regulator with XRE-family HTH domain